MSQSRRLPSVLPDITNVPEEAPANISIKQKKQTGSISANPQGPLPREKQLNIIKSTSILQGNVPLLTLMLQEAGADPGFIQEVEKLRMPQNKRVVSPKHQEDRHIASISSAIPQPSVFGYSLELYDSYDDLSQLSSRILNGETLHATMYKRDISTGNSHIEISNYSVYEDYTQFLRHLNDTYTREDVLVIGFNEYEQKFIVTPKNVSEFKANTCLEEDSSGTTCLCSRLMLKFCETEHALDKDSVFLRRIFEAHKLKALVERSHILYTFVTALIKSIQYIDAFSRGELGRVITNIPLIPIIKMLQLSPALVARTGCEVQIIQGISPGPEFFEDLLIKYFARNATIQRILKDKTFYPLLDSLLTDVETEYKRVHILHSLGFCRLKNAELDDFLLKYGIDRQLTDCANSLKEYNLRHMYLVLQQTNSRGGVITMRSLSVGTHPVIEDASGDQLTLEDISNNEQIRRQGHVATFSGILRHKEQFLKSRLWLEQHHYFYATPLQGAMFRFHLDCVDFFNHNLILFHPIVLTGNVYNIVQHILASGALDAVQKSSFYSTILAISVEEQHCLKKQDHEVAELYQTLLENQHLASAHSFNRGPESLKEGNGSWRVGDGTIYFDGRYEYCVGKQRIILPESITRGDYVTSIQQAAIHQAAMLREHGENVLSLSLIHSAPDVDVHIYRGEGFNFFKGWKSQCLFDALNAFIVTVYDVIETIFLPRLSQYLAPITTLQEEERRHASRICDEIFVHTLTETLNYTYETFLEVLKQGRRVPDLIFMYPDDTLSISIAPQSKVLHESNLQLNKNIPPELQLSGSLTSTVTKQWQQQITDQDNRALKIDERFVNKKFNMAFFNPNNNMLTRLTKTLLLELERLADRGIALLEDEVFNYEDPPSDIISIKSTPNYLYNIKKKVKELILQTIQLALHSTEKALNYLIEIPVTYALDSVPLVEITVELAVNSVTSDYVESIGLYACAYEQSTRIAAVSYKHNLDQLSLLCKDRVGASTQTEDKADELRKTASVLDVARHDILGWYEEKYTTTGYGTNKSVRDNIFVNRQESDLNCNDLSTTSTNESIPINTTTQKPLADILAQTAVVSNYFTSPIDDSLPHFTLNPSKSEFITKLSGLFDCYDTFVTQFTTFYDSISVDPENKHMSIPEYASGFKYIKEKRHMCLDYVEYCYQLPLVVLEVCNIICFAIFNRTLDLKIRVWADIISNTVDLPYYSLYHSTSSTTIEDFDYVSSRPAGGPIAASGAIDKRDQSLDDLDFDTIREITTQSQIQELSRRIRRGQIIVSDHLLSKLNAYYYSLDYWTTVRGIFDEGLSVNLFLNLVGNASKQIMARKEVRELILTEVVQAIIYYRGIQIFVQEHLFPDSLRYGFLCITTTPAKLAMERRISAILCSLGAIITTRAWTLIEYSNKITTAIQIQCSCIPTLPSAWHMLQRFIKFYIRPLQELIRDLSIEAMSYLNNILTAFPLKELSSINPQFDLGISMKDPSNWAAVLDRLSNPASVLVETTKYNPEILSFAKTTQFSWIFNRLIDLRMRTDIVYQPYKLASYLYSSTSPFGLNKLISQRIIPSAEAIISQSKYDLLMALETCREDLAKRQNDLLERVEAFTKKIPVQFSFDEASQDISYRFFKDSEALRNEMSSLQQECANFIDDERSLELAPGTFSIIEMLQPRIDMIYRFWSITYEHCTILPVWFNCLLSDLILKYAGKLGEFESTIFNNYTHTTDVLTLFRKAMQQEKSKLMLSSLNNGQKILLKIQSDLAWFKYHLPVILALLSPALKKRHLELLRTRGVFLNLTEHTISKLVERRVFVDLSDPNPQEKGFFHRAKLILDVVTDARKEHDIELSFNKIDLMWKTVSFEFQVLSTDKFKAYAALYAAHKADAKNVPSVHPITTVKAKIFDQNGQEIISNSVPLENKPVTASQEKQLYIIRNLDAILQCYRDHFLLTNKLLQSQHVTPMQRIIQQFMDKQFIIKEVLLLMKEIQELWIKLYPIYVGEYTSLFEAQATEFFVLTICLQTAYLGFISNCNVQNNITIAGNLNQVDKQIETGLRTGTIRFSDVPPNQLLTPLLFYYRALLIYLNSRMYSLVEVKRRCFYRLTFMNTNEVIQILSAPNGSSDAILTPLHHLYNFSDYTVIKRDKALLLDTVSSKSGEKIKLSSPVNVLAEVDTWLAAFDKTLHNTMRKLFHDLYIDVFVKNMELGIAFPCYPTCIVSLFLRVEFTNHLDAIFMPQVPDIDAYHMSVKLLGDINSRIIFFKNQFLSQSNKLLYGNILVELMYFRNIMTAICNQKLARDRRFIYIRIYKYRIVPLKDDAAELLSKTLQTMDENSALSSNSYMNQDPFIISGIINADSDPLDFDVQVSCLSNSMFYRFDYIPPTNRSIITEPMDQAATLMFSFLASRSFGGYIKGEAGKTEVVKHIAQCLGYKPYIVNPTYTVSFSEDTLHYTMLTACTFGLFICFEDVEKFTSSLLIALSRNMGHIYGTLNSYTSMQTIANCVNLIHDSSTHMKISLPAENPVGETYLHPSTIFFLTTNMPLPHSFNRVVKPFKCHLTDAAIHHIINTYMEIAGLTDIDATSSQLIHIMGVIQRLFTPFFSLRYIKDIISEMLLLSESTGKPWKRIVEQHFSSRSNMSNITDSRGSGPASEAFIEQREPITSSLRLVNLAIRNVIDPLMTVERRLLLHKMLDAEFGPIDLPPIEDTLFESIKNIYTDPLFCKFVFERTGLICPCSDLDYYAQKVLFTTSSTYKEAQLTIIRDIKGFIEVITHNIGSIILGNHLSGKTGFITICSQVYSKLCGCTVNLRFINFASISYNEFFGHFSSSDWIDGIIARLISRAEAHGPDEVSWVICDGVSKMNHLVSILNGTLFLPNGEILRVPSTVKFIFEVTNPMLIPDLFSTKCGIYQLTNYDYTEGYLRKLAYSPLVTGKVELNPLEVSLRTSLQEALGEVEKPFAIQLPDEFASTESHAVDSHADKGASELILKRMRQLVQVVNLIGYIVMYNAIPGKIYRFYNMDLKNAHSSNCLFTFTTLNCILDMYYKVFISSFVTWARKIHRLERLIELIDICAVYSLYNSFGLILVTLEARQWFDWFVRLMFKLISDTSRSLLESEILFIRMHVKPAFADEIIQNIQALSKAETMKPRLSSVVCTTLQLPSTINLPTNVDMLLDNVFKYPSHQLLFEILFDPETFLFTTAAEIISRGAVEYLSRVYALKYNTYEVKYSSGGLRYYILAAMLLTCGYSLTILGNQCSGKSTFVKNLFMMNPNHFKNDFHILHIPSFSAYNNIDLITTNIKKLIKSKLNMYTSTFYAPYPGNRTYLIFEDAETMSTAWQEVAREYQQNYFLYDERKYIALKDVVFLFVNKFSSDFNVDERYLKSSFFLPFYDISADEMRKLISFKMKIPDSRLTEKLVLCSYDLLHEMNAYITKFNKYDQEGANVTIQDLSHLSPEQEDYTAYKPLITLSTLLNVSNQISRYLKQFSKSVDNATIFKVWLHEMFREFTDSRDKSFYKVFTSIIYTLVQKHFDSDTAIRFIVPLDAMHHEIFESLTSKLFGRSKSLSTTNSFMANDYTKPKEDVVMNLSVIQEVSTSDETDSIADHDSLIVTGKEISQFASTAYDASNFTTNDQIQKELQHAMALPMFTYIFDVSIIQQGYQDENTEDFEQHIEPSEERPKQENMGEISMLVPLIKYTEVSMQTVKKAIEDADNDEMATEGTGTEKPEIRIPHAKRNNCFVTSVQTLLSVQRIARIIGIRSCVIVGMDGTGRSTSLRQAADNLRMILIEFNPLTSSWTSFINNALTRSVFMERLVIQLNQEDLEDPQILGDLEMYFSTGLIHRTIDTDEKITSLADYIKEMHMDLYGTLVEATHIGSSDLLLMYQRILSERVRFALIVKENYYYKSLALHPTFYKNVGVLLFDYLDNSTMAVIVTKLIPDLKAEKFLLDKVISKLHYLGYTMMLTSNGRNRGCNFTKLFINLTLAYFSYYNIQKELITEQREVYSMALEVYNMMKTILEISEHNASNAKQQFKKLEEAILSTGDQLKEAIASQAEASQAISKSTEHVALVNKRINEYATRIEQLLTPHANAVESSHQNLFKISTKELSAFKTLTKPNEITQIVFKIIYLLLENTVPEGATLYSYWIPCRKIVSAGDFIDRAITLDASLLTNEVVSEIMATIELPGYTADSATKTSTTMNNLMTWCNAVCSFLNARKEAAPLEEQLNQCRAEGEDVLIAHQKLKTDQEIIDKTILRLRDSLTKLKLEVETLQKKDDHIADRSRRISQFLAAFSGIKKHWESITEAKDYFRTSIGDSLLVCALVNYTGSMPLFTKVEFLLKCKKILSSNGIVYTNSDVDIAEEYAYDLSDPEIFATQALALKRLLISKDNELKLVCSGLKDDDNIIINAQIIDFVINDFQCYPLIHDPHEFLSPWLANFAINSLRGKNLMTSTNSRTSEMGSRKNIEAYSIDTKGSETDTRAGAVFLNSDARDFLANLRTELVKNSVVIIQLAPSFDQSRMSAITELLSHMLDVHTKIIFYNTQESNKNYQALLDKNKAIRDYIYSIDITSYNKNNQVLSRLSSICNPEIDASMVKLSTEYLTLFTSCEQVIKPRLYQMLRYIQTSLQDPNIGELVLDDTHHFDKLLVTLEQYLNQDSNLSKLMRRITEKETQRQEYHILASCTNHLRNITGRLTDRNPLYRYDFEKAFTLFETMVSRHMEKHNVSFISADIAEELIYEAIYLLITPSLDINEKLLFELNMALTKELEGKLYGPKYDILSSDILGQITKHGNSLDLLLDSNTKTLTSRSLRVTESALQSLLRVEKSYLFNKYLSGICEHIQSNPDVWDKALDAIRMVGNADLEAYNPAIISYLPSYSPITKTMPLSIWLVIIYQLDQSKFITVAKSYISNIFSFVKPNRIKDHITDTRLVGDRDWKPYLLLQTDAHMILDLERLAKARNIHMTMLLNKQKLLELCTTRTWVLLPDIQLHDDKELHCLIMIDLPAIYTRGGMHRDFKLFFTLSDSRARLSNDLLLNSIKIYWSTSHNIKNNLLTVYEEHFKDIYVKSEADEMTYGAVLNKLSYWLLFAFFVLNERLTAPCRINVLRFYDALNEIRNTFLLTVQSLGRLKVTTKGSGITLGIPLARALNANRHVQDQGVKHYIPTEVECHSIISFEGIYYIFGGLYMRSEIEDEYDGTCFEGLLRKLITPSIFDIEKYRAHPVYGRYIINLQSLFSISQSSNVNILHEINQSVSSINHPDLWLLDNSIHDMLAYREFCLFLRSSTSPKSLTLEEAAIRSSNLFVHDRLGVPTEDRNIQVIDISIYRKQLEIEIKRNSPLMYMYLAIERDISIFNFRVRAFPPSILQTSRKIKTIINYYLKLAARGLTTTLNLAALQSPIAFFDALRLYYSHNTDGSFSGTILDMVPKSFYDQTRTDEVLAMESIADISKVRAEPVLMNTPLTNSNHLITKTSDMKLSASTLEDPLHGSQVGVDSTFVFTNIYLGCFGESQSPYLTDRRPGDPFSAYPLSFTVHGRIAQPDEIAPLLMFAHSWPRGNPVCSMSDFTGEAGDNNKHLALYMRNYRSDK